MNGNASNQSAPLTYVLAIAGALLIVMVLVWAMVRYTQPGPLNQDKTAERLKNLAELRNTETPILTQYAWQDQTKDLVRLPITNAMDLVVREYQQDPAAVRALLIERIDKATAPPPETPSLFE